MKKIPLTQGQMALVDDADYDWLNQWKWYAEKRSGSFYAARGFYLKNGKHCLIYMSRLILGLKHGDSQLADHENHNTLDNRQSNLRIATRQQNNMNRKPNLNTTSRFKGVSWYKSRKKWRACIKINGIIKHLGYFNLEKKAALVYNLAAKRYFGEFAWINRI